MITVKLYKSRTDEFNDAPIRKIESDDGLWVFLPRVGEYIDDEKEVYKVRYISHQATIKNGGRNVLIKAVNIKDVSI